MRWGRALPPRAGAVSRLPCWDPLRRFLSSSKATGFTCSFPNRRRENSPTRFGSRSTARHSRRRHSGGKVSARCLLSDAEGAENEVEDVVGGGGTGDLVQRTERVVEIKQKHLVGNLVRHRGPGGGEGDQSILHQSLVTGTGQEAALSLHAPLATHVPHNLSA